MSLRITVGALVVVFGLAAGQDVRGLGMGRLTLVLESEARPFDMYGFGANPAGLFRSELPHTGSCDRAGMERTSVLELYAPVSYWRYAGASPYEWAVGDPLPRQYQEYYPRYMDGGLPWDGWYHITGDWIPYVPFAARPSGVLWRYRSKFALAVRGSWSHAATPGYHYYISTSELGVAAAAPLGPLDIGLELPASAIGDTLVYDRERMAFIGYRMGVVVPLRMLELGAILYEDWRHAHVDIPPIASGWIPSGTAGGYALQAMLRPADWIEFGAAGGRRSANPGPVFSSPWVSVRAECRPTRLPVLAALNAEWTRMRTQQPTFETDQMDSTGVGAGLGAKIWRLSGGAELHYMQRTYPEDTGAVKCPNWVTNAGAEIDLGAVQVRLGYEHSVRPIMIAPGYGFNKYTGTAGFGLNVASLRVDVAWNHSYWPFGKEIQDEFHLEIKRGW